MAGMIGCALANSEVEAQIYEARERQRAAAEAEQQLLALLEARVNEAPGAWSEPAAGFTPAKPEAPDQARTVLLRVNA